MVGDNLDIDGPMTLPLIILSAAIALITGVVYGVLTWERVEDPLDDSESFYHL